MGSTKSLQQRFQFIVLILVGEEATQLTAFLLLLLVNGIDNKSCTRIC